MSKRAPDPLDDAEAERIARRKLMRLACYLPPALLATFVAKDSFAAASCGPSGCGPDVGCMPPGHCTPHDDCNPGPKK